MLRLLQRWNKWYVTICKGIIDVRINDARELSIDLISINWRTLFKRSALKFMICSSSPCLCSFAPKPHVMSIESWDAKNLYGRLMLEIGSNNCLTFITSHYTLRMDGTHTHALHTTKKPKTEHGTANPKSEIRFRWPKWFGLRVLKLKHCMNTACVCEHYDSFRVI